MRVPIGQIRQKFMIITKIMSNKNIQKNYSTMIVHQKPPASHSRKGLEIWNNCFKLKLSTYIINCTPILKETVADLDYVARHAKPGRESNPTTTTTSTNKPSTTEATTSTYTEFQLDYINLPIDRKMMIKHEVLLQKLDERKALLRKVCLFRRDIEQKLNLLLDNSQPLKILGELKAMKEDIEEDDSHPVLPKCTPKYPDNYMFAKDKFNFKTPTSRAWTSLLFIDLYYIAYVT